MTGLDRDKVRRDFEDAVNLTATELKAWLDTEESRTVGWKGKDGKGSGESVGHASGRRILAILGKASGDLTGDELAHMRGSSAMCAVTGRRSRRTSPPRAGAIR